MSFIHQKFLLDTMIWANWKLRKQLIYVHIISQKLLCSFSNRIVLTPNMTKVLNRNLVFLLKSLTNQNIILKSLKKERRRKLYQELLDNNLRHRAVVQYLIALREAIEMRKNQFHIQMVQLLVWVGILKWFQESTSKNKCTHFDKIFKYQVQELFPNI